MGGVNPGSLASQMPARDDDIQRKIRDQQRALREQGSANTLQAAQFGKGGIVVTDNGSITISGTGSLNVGSGALNSAGSISAGTTVTAGGNITSTGGSISAAGGITGAALSVSGAIGSGSLTTGAISATGVASSGNVSASGQVISSGVVNSPGTKANTVTVGYSAVYIDSSGNMGGNTSSRRFKQDIVPVQTDTAGFLGLTTYQFRYKAAVEELGDAAPLEYGLIAEEVVKVAPWACFYEADGVTVRGINYDRLIVAAMNVMADHERRLQAAGL